MFYINYNPNKTLPETFYKKNSDFFTKNRCQFKKKTALRWVLGGFFWAGFLLPTLILHALFMRGQ
jgi:hypothetical protein